MLSRRWKGVSTLSKATEPTTKSGMQYPRFCAGGWSNLSVAHYGAFASLCKAPLRHVVVGMTTVFGLRAAQRKLPNLRNFQSGNAMARGGRKTARQLNMEKDLIPRDRTPAELQGAFNVNPY